MMMMMTIRNCAVVNGEISENIPDRHGRLAEIVDSPRVAGVVGIAGASVTRRRRAFAAAYYKRAN